MTAIVAGGRNLKITRVQALWLMNVLKENNVTKIIEGGSRGADFYGYIAAIKLGIDVEEYKADWERYGKLAGPMRNQLMVNDASMLIAFPGGKGTSDVTQRAKRAGLKIISWEEYDERSRQTQERSST